MKLLLLWPRGYCAGVRRAIATVETALDRAGAPVYVRGPIVHNRHVVERLAARGALFVDDLEQVPPGEVVVFSAHGVSPAVVEQAARLGLRTIDATCPLVARVHRQVRRAIDRGDAVVLVGHDGHDEVIGTLGQAPAGAISLVGSVDQAERVVLPVERRIVMVTQTTLCPDDVAAVTSTLARRFGTLLVPAENICHATRDRQGAIRQAVARGLIHALLVVGSPSSSNSQRLVEVGRAHGVRASLIDSASEIERIGWLQCPARDLAVGVTSGASTPEDVVARVVARLRSLGAWVVDPPGIAASPSGRSDERIDFALPSELFDSAFRKARGSPT